jgi:hypothetical protein
MSDITWIAQEAERIHYWLHGLFFLLVTVFLLFGVVVEYFKMPLGGTPSFGPLVGRALVASLLLYSYPEISNLLRAISQGLSEQLGELAHFKTALQRMGEKVEELSWSWTSVRQSVIVAVSYLSFFLLYFSVHVAQATYLYASVLLYVVSPLLIALFVLPQTSGATKGLFCSLIEISLWKPLWCIIATLVWSTGVSSIQGEGTGISFLSAICFSLIGAGSLLITPVVVHALAGAGLSSMTSNLSSISVPGVGSLTPGKAMTQGWQMTGHISNATLTGIELATSRAQRAQKIVKAIPRFNVPQRPPIFIKKTPNKKGKS